MTRTRQRTNRCKQTLLPSLNSGSRDNLLPNASYALFLVVHCKGGPRSCTFEDRDRAHKPLRSICMFLACARKVSITGGIQPLTGSCSGVLAHRASKTESKAMNTFFCSIQSGSRKKEDFTRPEHCMFLFVDKDVLETMNKQLTSLFQVGHEPWARFMFFIPFFPFFYVVTAQDLILCSTTPYEITTATSCLESCKRPLLVRIRGRVLYKPLKSISMLLACALKAKMVGGTQRFGPFGGVFAHSAAKICR